MISGSYRLVRHPLYLFSLFLFRLFPCMTDLTLAFFLAATPYFMLGTFPEERKCWRPLVSRTGNISVMCPG